MPRTREESMRIGVPKEIKSLEYLAGLLTASVRGLITCVGVARSLGYEYTEASEALAA
jgi:alanine dehydrogenase|tara:strand:+ start:333 stop:506 length:174 start_codon:yes stop_codon:yes gene_type:complete